MRLFEREHTQITTNGRMGSLDDIRRMIDGQLHDGQTPIRFAVTESSRRSFRYEIGILEGTRTSGPSIFDIHPRQDEDASAFNAVLVVPTGIGAEIGGHAGDATPVARLARLRMRHAHHPPERRQRLRPERDARQRPLRRGQSLEPLPYGRYRLEARQIEPCAGHHRRAPERAVRAGYGQRRQRRAGNLRSQMPACNRP